jgi:putative photosynthetic complex assembly protein 2
MAQYGLAILAAILTWWLSTGVILVLSALPRTTYPWSMACATLLLVPGFYGLALSAGDETSSGAYIAFLCTICVWGWIEMSFLFGYVTGPNKEPCPPYVRGWQRFLMAARVVIYHELTIVLGACAIVALTWAEPNQTAALTFVVLMLMRISAKLNIFLGVPNLTDEFMPTHLSYMRTYFRKRSFNALFPVSVILSLIAVYAFAEMAGNAMPGSADSVGATLLCALVSLALLEHLFMMMPLRDAALWKWFIPDRLPKAGK